MTLSVDLEHLKRLARAHQQTDHIRVQAEARYQAAAQAWQDAGYPKSMPPAGVTAEGRELQQTYNEYVQASLESGYAKQALSQALSGEVVLKLVSMAQLKQGSDHGTETTMEPLDPLRMGDDLPRSGVRDHQ